MIRSGSYCVPTQNAPERPEPEPHVHARRTVLPDECTQLGDFSLTGPLPPIKMVISYAYKKNMTREMLRNDLVPSPTRVLS